MKLMARRVHCDGVYPLAAQGDQHTLRSVCVTLSVRAPRVSAAVEARLAEMLRAVFEAEAAVLGGGS
jgi:hypothetical protein